MVSFRHRSLDDNDGLKANIFTTFFNNLILRNGHLVLIDPSWQDVITDGMLFFRHNGITFLPKRYHRQDCMIIEAADSTIAIYVHFKPFVSISYVMMAPERNNLAMLFKLSH